MLSLMRSASHLQGYIESYSEGNQEHTILYDDGDREQVTLPDETVVFL